MYLSEDQLKIQVGRAGGEVTQRYPLVLRV